jgi:protein-tyrosine phosphatase
MKKYFSKNS